MIQDRDTFTVEDEQELMEAWLEYALSRRSSFLINLLNNFLISKNVKSYTFGRHA